MSTNVSVSKCAFGPYETNCYIVNWQDQQWIIDPGMGASEWVLANAPHPVAILNTHGHFDHVWDNAQLQQQAGLDVYAPEADDFLMHTRLMPGQPPCHANVWVEANQTLEIGGQTITWHHFPGHCPGNSMIEFVTLGLVFSGDFIFHRAIGRYDFSYASADDMQQSLLRFQQQWADRPPTTVLYPGHGSDTTLGEALTYLPHWLAQFD